MLTLQPQNSFTIVRQIANHTDTGTYYVRTVIRNAYTDEIIATLDLEDKGGQRFTKNWQVPGDPSGQGFYISAVSSVYIDSGYTTKSENYGDEETTYLVQDRLLLARGGGGVDAYTVRRIIQEELAGRPNPTSPEPVMRWGEVLAALSSIKAALVDAPTVDLSPVLNALARVQQTIENKPVTPAADLAPVLATLKELRPLLTTLGDRTLEARKVQVLIEGLSYELRTTVGAALKGAKASVSSAPIPTPFDVSKLAL